jgi:hypothetical protein
MTIQTKEQALEKIEEIKKFIEQEDSKPERWKPEHRARYFYVGGADKGVGDYIWHDDPIDNQYYKTGDCFKTKEEAERHKLRLESMANRWRPAFDEEYYTYDLSEAVADSFIFRNNRIDISVYWIGNCHKTGADAKAWGEKYAKAFSLDSK